MSINNSENAGDYQENILATASRRDSVTEKLAKELISVSVRDFVSEACKLFKIKEPTKDDSLTSAVLELQEMLKFPKRDNKNGQDGILGAITIAALIKHFPELQKYSLSVKQRDSLSGDVAEDIARPAPVARPAAAAEPAAHAEPAKVDKRERVVSANQVILVGDSLTVGYRKGVSVEGKKIPTSSHAEYVQGGKSILAMKRDLQTQLNAGKLDNVISAAILGGANNVAIHSSEKIIGALKDIVKILTSKKPPAHVVLVTLPPMLGYKGFISKEKIRQRTDEINNWIRAQSQADPKQISCVDLYSMIDDPKRPGYTKKELTSDGLHLSGTGYNMLASAVKKAIG